MFQNWLHHLKCFILILINFPFNWVEKEKVGKRKIENGKIRFFFFFLGVVGNRVGKFIQDPKTILPNLEKKWAEHVSYI